MHNSALLSLFAVISTFASCSFAGPVRRRSLEDWSSTRSRWGPWSSAYAGGMAGAWPGPAAMASTGAGFFVPFPVPFVNPSDYMPPMVFPKPYFPISIPWYKGDNVCVDEEMIPEPFKDSGDGMGSNTEYNHESQHCRGGNNKYICEGWKNTNDGSKLYKTTYQCCHGFVRAPYGEPGCVEIDLKDLAPTLRDLKANRFVDMASDLGIREKLHDENFTIFCPKDDAWSPFIKPKQELKNELVVLPGRGTKQKKPNTKLLKMITSHMIKGFLKSDDIEDENILQSENYKSTIRLNIYYIPYKLLTANCVPVTSMDNFARNGVIHMIEKVLPIPTKTVADIIASDPQFSTLKGLLSTAGLVQRLRNPKSNFTVFAPTDSAFRLKPHLLDKIRNGNVCASSLMKNHILEHVICASALPNYAQSLNMLGELLTLSREFDNKIYVDDVQVVVKDIMGINGVVHIIDGLLMPRQATSVVQVLQETGMTEFLDLLELADLKSAFDGMHNVTFFVPSNEAIRKLRTEQNRWGSRDSLQKTLLYHVAKTEFSISNTSDNQMLRTQLDDKNIRIKQYSLYPYITKQMTVQCARVLSPDNKLCGSILHVVDRLLVPSKRSVMDILESQSKFIGFVHLLRISGMDQRLRNQEESFTILTPVDDVFHKNSKSMFEILSRNRIKATEFVKLHILSEPLCCEQFQYSFYSGRRQARSIDGSLLRILSGPDGSIRIGDAKIIECDSTADNGVVHAVNSNVFPDRSRMNNAYYDNNL